MQVPLFSISLPSSVVLCVVEPMLKASVFSIYNWRKSELTNERQWIEAVVKYLDVISLLVGNTVFLMISQQQHVNGRVI